MQEDSEFSFNTSVDTGERERARKKERHLAGRTNREAVSTGGGGEESHGYFDGSVLIGVCERSRKTLLGRQKIGKRCVRGSENWG